MLTRCSWSADWRTITRPMPVEPVKLTLRSRSSAWSVLLRSAARVVGTMLSTPSGSPASARIAASASIVSGVCWAGLTTIVQPAATAGPILRVPIAIGKFHGVTNRHGTHGLLDGEQPAPASGGLHPAAVDAHRLLGVPAEELVAVGDLALGLLDGLAHLEAHQQREVVGAVGDHLEGAAQDLAAVPRWRRGPGRLRLGGGVEGVHRVRDGAVGDLREHRTVGWVEDVEDLVLGRVPPGSADEETSLFGGEEVETSHVAHPSLPWKT